ncbi:MULTISPECIES: hypothetical protein [unclassified Crossiella]|uniref:hypothetical protein n=1 Tax=unclassified Crossiella TaxID=2620835 RepID=UPI00200046C5|nr:MULTISPECIES: hypothetical protein [unclassified Crossiella]MCK2236447.1 hypothetical protein [Crossiella sp. S99.2]MCK2250114.1 hypothetical protein [Crossiella sp. S99.1]
MSSPAGDATAAAAAAQEVARSIVGNFAEAVSDQVGRLTGQFRDLNRQLPQSRAEATRYGVAVRSMAGNLHLLAAQVARALLSLTRIPAAIRAMVTAARAAFLTVRSQWLQTLSATTMALLLIRRVSDNTWRALPRAVAESMLAIRRTALLGWRQIQQVILVALNAIRRANAATWLAVQRTVNQVMPVLRRIITLNWRLITTATTGAHAQLLNTVRQHWRLIVAATTQSLRTLLNLVRQFWRLIQNAVQQAAQQIQHLWRRALDGMLAATSQFFAQVLDQLAKFQVALLVRVGILLAALTLAVGVFTLLVQKLVSRLLENILDQLTKFQIKLLLQVAGIFALVIAEWVAFTVVFGSLVESFLAGLLKKVKDFGEALVSSLDGKLTELTGKLRNYFRDLENELGPLLDAMGKRLGTRLAEAIQTSIIETFLSPGKWLKALITAIQNALRKIPLIGDVLAGFLDGVKPESLSTAGGFVNAFTVPGAAPGAAAAVPGGTSVVVNVYARPGQSEYEIGRIAAREVAWAARR